MKRIRQKLSLFCYGKASRRFYRTNQKLFQEGNRNAVRVLCLAGIFLCFCFGLSSTVGNVMAEGRIPMEVICLYTGGAALSAALYQICKRRILGSSLAVTVCFWTEYLLLYLLCVWQEIFYASQGPTVVIFIVTLLAATIYIDMPIRMILISFFSDVLFCGIFFVCSKQENTMIGELYQTGIITFGITAIFIHYVRNQQIINMQDKLRYQSRDNMDSLTGVLTKEYTASMCQIYLNEKLPEELCVVMVIAVDDFEGVQEEYGQQMGDNVLSTVGQILRDIFRERDIIGRIGSDQFLVCMKGVREERIVVKRANEIVVRFRQKVHDIGIDNGSCKIGVCCVRREKLAFEELFDRAVQMLWEAKQEENKTVKIKSEG